MEPESLPPIPTPVGQHWREFRIRALPPFVFLLVLGGLFLTWSNFIQPVSMVGMVETNAVNVLTAQAGLLTGLSVNRFDQVTNGQVIGQIELFDAEQIRAELAALESAAGVVNAKTELLEWGKMDAAIMIKLNLFSQQAVVDVARIKFEQASNVVETDKQLTVAPAVVSPMVVREHIAQRDAAKAEWLDRARMVDQWFKELEHVGPVATNLFDKVAEVLKQDILKQQDQLRQLQKPIVLRAPITGKISSVIHHSGERIPAGAPIVTITSSEAKRIVGYVRQPINYRPKLGDVVTVRTRTTRRHTFDAQIVQIGTQLEGIGPLLLPMAKTIPEIGLPIALNLPDDAHLLPGEIVDLKLQKAKD